MVMAAGRGSWFASLLRERSTQLAVSLWIVGSIVVFPLIHREVRTGGGLPLHRPTMAGLAPAAQVLATLVTLAGIFLLMGLTYLLTRHRVVPDLASRAPERDRALRETVLLWLYGSAVLAVGRVVGLHFFGEGFGLHLNGSLFGATRVQSPGEVWTWALYNFIFFAVAPYLVFRLQGYSREALNLKSANLRNDTLVIVMILAVMCALDLASGSLANYRSHQTAENPAYAIVKGVALSFTVHLLGTGLPVMVFIYAILIPRYVKLTSSLSTATVLGAASYAALHIFEYWTIYDSASHAILSLIFVFLTFFPPGLMKSYLTLRTGNAWVHLWAFHAISPHVTLDTHLIIRDFSLVR